MSDSRPLIFAVAPRKIERDESYSERSSSWQLYDVAVLAAKLGVNEDELREALEETGFMKLIRIRKELIAFKERLRKYGESKQESWCLRQVRNILRIPREEPGWQIFKN